MGSLLISDAIPLPQISSAFGAVTASYTLVGTFDSSTCLMIITSTLDAAVQLSFDGTNDHIAVPAGNTSPCVIELNFKTNRMIMPVTSVYVKRIGAPGAGSIFISAFSSQLP